MLILFLLLSCLLQIAAVAVAFGVPRTPRARLAWTACSAALLLMALHRVFRLVGAWIDPGISPGPTPEALLEVTVSTLALGGALAMKRVWDDATRALAGAQHREQLRSEGEELWQRVFDFAPDGYVLLATDGILHRMNRAAEEIVGMPRARSEGRSIFDTRILDETGKALAARQLRAAAGQTIPEPVEYTFHRLDGSTREVEISGYPLEFQGRAMMLTIIHDVTRRRRVEQELRRSTRRLEQAQRAAGLVVFETDLVTGTIWVSQDPRTAPCDSTAGIRMPVADAFEFIVPEDRERVILQTAASTAEGGSGEIVVEYRQRPLESAEIRTVRTTARAEKNERGDFVRMVGATLDITEIREAEKEIRTLNAQLEERVRDRTIELKRAIDELEAFSYSVSHDLRSPLRAMAGYSQMVLDEDGTKIGEESRAHLERIRASSVRMAGLIDGLLSLSRLTRRTRNDEPVDISELARSLATELRHADPSRSVDVQVADGLTAVADAGMISLVLQNLLANAWKFTRPCEAARIEVGRDAKGAFFVRDNGVGFDPEQKAKLFRPFERLHRTDEFEGTGIGLATVARIVRHYGGRVWADGAIGKGSTFWFSLSPDAGSSRSDDA